MTSSQTIIILISFAAAVFLVGILLTCGSKIKLLEQVISRDRATVDDLRKSLGALRRKYSRSQAEADKARSSYHDMLAASALAHTEEARIVTGYPDADDSDKGSLNIYIGTLHIRRFPFCDADSRDYARLQAEELCDMLNSSINLPF